MKNKEVKLFIKKVRETYGFELSKKDKFELDDNLVIINGSAKFFYYETNLVQSLKLILENNLLKTVTVDMGAVKFVVKGADIMRPGLLHIDESIEKNEFVTVIDETHEKPLAVGIALFSGTEIEKMDSGKVIKTLHYVGDKIWNYH